MSATTPGGAALLAALLATGAWGNPVMGEGFFAVQVPGTRHVQLTYLDAMSKPPKVGTYVRDAKAYALTWKTFEGYVADQGSGVESYVVTQACDCNVPVGQHTFQTLLAGPSAGFWGGQLGATLEVLGEKVVKRKTEEELAEEQGLAEYLAHHGRRPAPKGPQGLDCRKECAAGVTAPLAAEQPKDTAVHGEARATSGWLLLEGRFVRPPYALVLDDYKLTVNGQTARTWPRFTDASAMRRELEQLTSNLKDGAFVIWCKEADFVGRATPEEAAAWLKEVDEVVKLKADHKAKREKLGRLKKNLIANLCAGEALDHWDGSP